MKQKEEREKKTSKLMFATLAELLSRLAERITSGRCGMKICRRGNLSG